MKKDQVFKEMMDKSGSTKERLFVSAAYLFSVKGFDRVGVRELCQSVGIKESSFYNHFKSKNEVLQEMFSYFTEHTVGTLPSDAELEAFTAKGDVSIFLHSLMRKFSSNAQDYLYSTILQIVLMESYTNPEAYKVAKHNLYYIRRDCTEKGLDILLEKGTIRNCDIQLLTREFYYGLLGMLNEQLLLEIWDEDAAVMRQRIGQHIAYFASALKREE